MPTIEANPRCSGAWYSRPTPSWPRTKRWGRIGACRWLSSRRQRSRAMAVAGPPTAPRGVPAFRHTAARDAARPEASWSGRCHARTKDGHRRPHPLIGVRPGRAACRRPPVSSRRSSGITSCCLTRHPARRPSDQPPAGDSGGHRSGGPGPAVAGPARRHAPGAHAVASLGGRRGLLVGRGQARWSPRGPLPPRATVGYRVLAPTGLWGAPRGPHALSPQASQATPSPGS
jgi:hypothetical protein